MFLRRAALPLCFTVVATLFASSVAACSSSKDEDPAATPAPGVDGGSPQGDTGTPQGDGGKEETEIVFDKSTTFGKRACSLTLRVAGGGNEVKLAGEFTDWAAAALPMTKTAT